MSDQASKILSSKEIHDRLNKNSEWRMESDALVRTFTFGDFREAMSFVNSVAMVAEEAGHHPDIDIRYNKVKLVLSSHDAGGITEDDFLLAAQVEQVF